MENYRILIVDDDENLRIGMATILEEEGFEVHEAENGRAGIERLEKSIYDLIITDYKMNEMDGLKFLKQLKDSFPSMKVIMVTGFGSIEHAVEAMKLGAINYLTKPIKPKELIQMVKSILGVGLPGDLSPAQKQKQLSRHFHFHKLVGQSKVMQQVYRRIKEVASADIPVLITGESGTGKEMVALAIHELSKRR